MEIEEIVTADIPNWALSYLIYDDATGLSEEDKNICDEWWCAMRADGYLTVSPTDETNEFCAYPEFGLACDTTKCEIIKWKEK